MGGFMEEVERGFFQLFTTVQTLAHRVDGF